MLAQNKDGYKLLKSGRILNLIRGLKTSDAATVGQTVQVDTSGNVSATYNFTGANTHAGVETHAGAETHSGAEVFSNALGLLTNVITPRTAGAGTAIQQPIIQGQTFAAPVTLTTAQSGSLCISDAAAGTKWILPAATAVNTGVSYKFYCATTVTSNSLDVEGATSSDLMVAGGYFFQLKAATDGTAYSPNGTTNFKVTMNGTTTGGIIGDYFTVTCLGLNKWLVTGQGTASGTVATPFAG